MLLGVGCLRYIFALVIFIWESFEDLGEWSGVGVDVSTTHEELLRLVM